MIYRIIGFITFCCIIAHSQDDSTTVAFVSYWNKNDSFRLKVTKTKKAWEQNQLTKNDSSSYSAVFSIIDSTDSSYKIRWSFNNDYRFSYNVPESFQQKFAKYDLTDVIYTTTELGVFVGVENWKQVGESMSNVFDELIEALGEDEKKIADVKSAMLALKPVYNSKQGIERIILKELQFFHFPFGVKFTITDTITYEEYLPNMFGGEPIKANAKLFFEEVDFIEKRCVFRNQMTLDPKDTRALILGLLKKMGLDNQEMETAFNKAKFEITDNHRFEYYYYPGIPIKIETRRVTIVKVGGEDGKRVDNLKIELVP